MGGRRRLACGADMAQFLQQMVNGLSIGSVYALMAVGYSLVYSVMNFSNFAHGGVIMFGAYFGFYAITLLKLPFPAAFVLAFIGTAALAVLIERVAYKPLRERNAPFLYFIISALMKKLQAYEDSEKKTNTRKWMI